ncbi:MAG: alpha/beta fold hydrolase [Burkholderiaceae bacterium]|nr:alpha/beta fold hydrolase [Burkholderiaceae bacterium]
MPRELRGVELAYELRLPKAPFTDLLIFYHGGGAHRGAGYGCLGEALAREAGLAVCLPDLRGHGASEGPRGFAPNPQAVWDDVDALCNAVAREFSGVRLHLGGHSSGAGLLVNYLTLHKPNSDIKSLILLAPDFGFRARLYRGGTTFGSFARVSQWPFLLSAFSGGRLGNGIAAVHFDYGDHGIPEGCVAAYTVGMANAVTPTDPASQLKQILISMAVALPENDELIDVARLAAFLEQHAGNNASWDKLPGLGHLDVLCGAAPFVRSALSRINSRIERSSP